MRQGDLESEKLLKDIELMRDKLNQYNIKNESSGNKKLIRISQELDALLNKYQDLIEKNNTE